MSTHPQPARSGDTLTLPRTRPARPRPITRRQHRTHLMHWVSVGLLVSGLALLAGDAGVVQAMAGAGVLGLGLAAAVAP